MKKLFKTTISIDMLSTAETASEAEKIAWANLQAELEENSNVVSVEMKNTKDIPEDWRDVVPFSNPPQETKPCRAILADIIAATPASQKIVEVLAAPTLPKASMHKPQAPQKPELETIKEQPKPQPTTTTTTTPRQEAPRIEGPTLPRVRF